MFKLITFLCLLSFIVVIKCQQFCPYPFVNSANGYTFNNCYYYAGVASDYSSAVRVCANVGAFLVTAKDSRGLDDLYKLYKAYTNYYFWVGATASVGNPFNFNWQDGSPVYPTSFCSGHPKGGNNVCGFYTTKAVIGRDKCLSTGPCSGTFFDHGAICQYGVNVGK